MEYKIFGAGGSPDDEFRAELQAFCDLDDVQSEALAAWFESTDDFDTYATELPPGIRASTLLPEQFRDAAAPMLFLLDSWHVRSLQLADLERDLLLLGFNSEQLARITGFLARLSGIKERVWLKAREVDAQELGLPTIEEANIVWDARPFFGSEGSHNFRDNAEVSTYRQCLGLTCMAALEMIVSDSSGLKQRIAVQLNESDFKMFLGAVNRANDQLQSLKEFIEPLTRTSVERVAKRG